MEPAHTAPLLAGAVDYAGLFPPAALSMAAAVAEYRAAQAGADAWMLGRFVVPATRLAELSQVLASGEPPLTPWVLSAIVRDRSESDRTAIAEFNASARGHATVDAIEAKPDSPDGIDWLADAFGTAFAVYVEIAASPDVESWMTHVAARGLRAKVRTGGLTAEAFPAPDALLRFIETAVRLDVAFKATAGLHHALRGEYPLTYEADAPHATMYGYLNVLLATAALREGLSSQIAADVLRRTGAASLTLADDGVRWGDVRISTDTIRRTRDAHMVSFGSCSFREPADEYRGLTIGLTSTARG
jgi:hypothetical protein